jgi:hypothetical protein
MTLTRTSLLKYIMANFNVGKDAKTVNVHLKLSLRAGVKNKSLKQSKGTCASGTFKIGEVVKPKSLEMYLPFFDSKLFQRCILFDERFDFELI